MKKKTEQLKLDLFEESLGTCLDDYLDNRGYLKQIQLQTGKPRGTFSRTDPHPWVKNLFYRQWDYRDSIEMWATFKAVEKETIYNRKRHQSEHSKKYRQERKEHYKAWYKKYRKENKEKIAAKQKAWKKNNKALIDAYDARRRAIVKKSLAELSEREEGLIKQFYAYRIRLQDKLGIPFHVDHIVPLSIGGLHHPSNLQVVPASWNRSKHNRNTERWLPNGL